MSDSNNFHHLRKQRKLLHKHISFQFPTSCLKFDFHLVCFIKPPQSDLKGVAGNYAAAEGKKWHLQFTLKEQEGRGLGSLAEKQLVSTRNLLSVVWPHSAAGQRWGSGDSTIHSQGQEEVQRLWAAPEGLCLHQPAHLPPCTLLQPQHSQTPPFQPCWGSGHFSPRAWHVLGQGIPPAEC